MMKREIIQTEKEHISHMEKGRAFELSYTRKLEPLYKF